MAIVDGVCSLAASSPVVALAISVVLLAALLWLLLGLEAKWERASW